MRTFSIIIITLIIIIIIIIWAWISLRSFCKFTFIHTSSAKVDDSAVLDY